LRIRTILSFASGAAAGAGWMYLADPDHGPARRREFRRSALRQARDGARSLAAEARRRAESYALAAAAGFEQGRVGERADPTTRPPSGRSTTVA
jgi:uncharacterized membrane protein